jgi:hypothetical protein
MLDVVIKIVKEFSGKGQGGRKIVKLTGFGLIKDGYRMQIYN